MGTNKILLCCAPSHDAISYIETLSNIEVETIHLNCLDIDKIKQKTRYENFAFILWHASMEEINQSGIVSQISHDEVAGQIPLVVILPEHAPIETRTMLYQYGATNIMGAPIHSNELSALASVYLTYQQRQKDMTDMIGEVASLTVHLQREIEYRKTIEADLYKASVTDSLTQSLNRRAFIEFGEKEMERFDRYKTACCLAYLDLDFFKSVNDTYGHQGGDMVLQQFSKLLVDNCRKLDIIGRIGGEEFGIILPETSLKGAATKMEQIRKLVENTPCTYGNTSISYTVSIGISECEKQENLLEWMMVQADKNLYLAKEQGRNSVVC
jgi:diguanylate cyclase (GGDEF)-like protein